MKKLLLYTVFFFAAVFGYAQNLVPNFGFDIHNTCPTTEDQAQYATGWFKISEVSTTPDYYSACAPTSGYGVPKSNGQYQQDSRACGAYMGLLTKYLPQSFPNYREQVSIQLTQPLVIGQKYYLSFLTVMAGQYDGTNYYDNPSNNMGMRFSTISYSSSNPAPIENFAHLHSAAIINDTINWTRVSGSFIADSVYQYVMLGNFFDDASTDTISLNCAACLNYYSYYLFDNVCVSMDSAYCNGGIDTAPCTVSIRELSDENEISVFPNPVSDVLNISFNDIQSEFIQLTDVLGAVIYSENTKGKDSMSISLSAFPSGVYFLKFTSKKEQKIISKKILKL